MKKLFLDFDSTIVNSIKAFCDVYNYQYKNHKNFARADWTKVEKYDLKDQCPLLKNRQETMEIFEDQMFFNVLTFIDSDAEEVIEKLSKEYDISICTIGTPMNLAHKALWLKHHLPCVKKYILLCNDNCKMDKSIIDMRNGILIDDHADNLISSNAEIKICFGKEYEWNKWWVWNRITKWSNAIDVLNYINPYDHECI